MHNQILLLVNLERSKYGVMPVALCWQLSQAAEYKSKDMRDKNYFSHSSPVYGSLPDMLKQFNIPYLTAGENIAKGQISPEAVMRAWTNSGSHLKNIINPAFNKIGVGYCAGSGTTYWTQIFTG